jgi:hypothetical protein
MAGKGGTLAPSDFESLKGLVGSFGASTLALKVAKACNQKAAALNHEYPKSAVAAAYVATASKITNAGLGSPKMIPGSAFVTVGQMVGKYGAELVVQKLAKSVKKTDASLYNKLNSIFPKIS